MRLIKIAAILIGLAAVAAGCTTTSGESDEPLTIAASAEYHHGEIRRVPSATGCIALTFDDGPHPTFTPRLLQILAEEQAVATFFMVGQRVAQWPEIAAAVAASGHEIGNHSWSHTPFTQLGSEAILRELAATDAAIAAATSGPPSIVRLPYDASSERVLALIDRPVIFWDIDTLDWDNHSAGRIGNTIAAHARSGSIILLHDIHSTTIAAVRPAIEALKARGFQFVTVSRLLSGRPCAVAAG